MRILYQQNVLVDSSTLEVLPGFYLVNNIGPRVAVQKNCLRANFG